MARDPVRKDSRGWGLRLEDMVAAVRRILQYTAGATFEQFAADHKMIDAVLHNFAILGEAARHVPPEIEAARPDLPWSEMRTMRNVAVHVYHGIKLPRVWETIGTDLPALLPLLEAMLADLDRRSSDPSTSADDTP